ncbi:flavin-containing monooxygenase [Phyllosticta citriasiana]|uniref:Flavin-containing monooxygenase n=1 Tax=Phyllosticta citriasiana TaxID=595635 RepID=A0ABR1KMH8_9PEZI
MLATDSIHTIQLPNFTPKHPSIAPSSPTEVTTKWFAAFQDVLANPATLGSRLPTIFHPDCWWRDKLGLSWDFRTLRGIDAVRDYLLKYQPTLKLRPTSLAKPGTRYTPQIDVPMEGLEWIEAMFDWETTIGRGKGIIRLAQREDGQWKGYMVYTTLEEIKGHEEQIGHRRPHGGRNSLVGGGNWAERREREKEFVDEEPTVICIGAGQAGLNMAARFKALGVPCLVIDQNDRIGDNWRKRYRTLVTHDPAHFTHMAYLPFPPTWPIFTPKDKLADWFESYASLLELNVWMRTTITESSYDDATHKWTVTVVRRDAEGNTTTRIMHPKHIIMCTGHSGKPKVPNFPNQAAFQGKLYHGSEHKDASLIPASELASKRIVVVGTGNSGHDIAQNYHEAGAASVTMLQRRGTYVISALDGKGIFMMHEGLYDEDGPPTQDADVYGESLPNAVNFALNVDFTRRVAKAEAAVLDGLDKAGFARDAGPDGSGLMRKYLTRGGGYYIDVGASQLVADGKIKVVRSEGGIASFSPTGLVLADGHDTHLPADVVVLATGYDNMKTSVAKALGEEHAARCADVWDLDAEGEIRTMWRPSGHPGLWFCGGNLAMCRIHSRTLALQILACEVGLNRQDEPCRSMVQAA